MMEQNQQPLALPCVKTPKTKREVTPAPPYIALYAVLAAIISSFLIYPSFIGFFYGESIYGINIPLCIGLLYGAVILSMRGQRKVDWRRGWPMLLFIVPLAVAPALFSVPELIWLDFLALCVMVPMHLSLLSGSNWTELTGVSLFVQVLTDIFARPFMHIADGTRATVGKGSGKGVLRSLLLAMAGAAVAAPLLAAVVALLAYADKDFSAYISAIFGRVDVPQIILVLLMSLAVLFPLISILYSLPLGKNTVRSQTEYGSGKGIPAIPVYVALAMFDVVLLLFAAIRIKGLVGQVFIHARDYAVSAHEGFFPMLAAAVICYGVQWFCLRFTQRQGKALPLRLLVTALSAGLIVMMASALQSILRYQGVYGMTRLRMYVTVCIGVLFVLLVLTLLSVWFMKKRLYRTLVAAVLCASLIGVNYMNIDRMIARCNMELSQASGQSPDYYYLLTLSADALDIVASHADEMDSGEGKRLQRKLERNEREQWYMRTWNSGRARTQAAYEKMPGYAPQERR